MDLLTNAIESLRLGIEDYKEGSHGRLLTAIRNIHAGVLLLYKEALRRLSPADSNEVLVKAKITPKQDAKGQLTFVGDGRKTADVQQIRERFHAMGIATDWTRFDRITEARHEIEHYYTKSSQKALAGIISDTFIVVRNFITIELEENPLELLGDETWQAMLETSEVYETEREECRKAVLTVEWGSAALEEGVSELICMSCGGDLLRPEAQRKNYDADMTLECRACGGTMEARYFVPAAISSVLDDEKYEAYKDGGELPYTNCPSCGVEAYVMRERRCAYCEEAAEHICARCGAEIPPEELMGSPYCGWCAYMMAKDD